MVIAFLTVRFMPRDWHMLERPVSWPLIVCGQQSLEVFCVGRLSVVRNLFCARRSIERDLDAGAGQSFGCVIMTAVAAYRSWSKKIDKLPRTVAAPSSV